MQRESARFVDLADVLAFVDSTIGHGVPTRVAITRASKRYRLERELVLAAYRSASEWL